MVEIAHFPVRYCGRSTTMVSGFGSQQEEANEAADDAAFSFLGPCPASETFSGEGP
jgi:hypothetical protein